jgi:hypothetical protein
LQLVLLRQLQRFGRLGWAPDRDLLLLRIRMIFTFCAVAAASFLLVWGRQEPFQVLASYIEPRIVLAGGEVVTHRDIRILRTDCTGLGIRSQLVDSRGLIHQIDAQHGSPVLQSHTPDRAWPIPRNMPDGVAEYRATVSFSCAPFYSLWPVVVTPPPIGFVVDARRG